MLASALFATQGARPDAELPDDFVYAGPLIPDPYFDFAVRRGGVHAAQRATTQRRC